jgi:hypothetical protein
MRTTHQCILCSSPAQGSKKESNYRDHSAAIRSRALIPNSKNIVVSSPMDVPPRGHTVAISPAHYRLDRTSKATSRIVFLSQARPGAELLTNCHVALPPAPISLDCSGSHLATSSLTGLTNAQTTVSSHAVVHVRRTACASCLIRMGHSIPRMM